VLRVGDTIVMVSEAGPELEMAPTSGVGLYLYVPDADVAFKRAVEAGVTVVSPVKEQFWGDRCGTVKDEWGIRWTIATRTKEVTADEVKQASEKWMAEHKHELATNHTNNTA